MVTVAPFGLVAAVGDAAEGDPGDVDDRAGAHEQLALARVYRDVASVRAGLGLDVDVVADACRSGVGGRAARCEADRVAVGRATERLLDRRERARLRIGRAFLVHPSHRGRRSTCCRRRLPTARRTPARAPALAHRTATSRAARASVRLSPWPPAVRSRHLAGPLLCIWLCVDGFHRFLSARFRWAGPARTTPSGVCAAVTQSMR